MLPFYIFTKKVIMTKCFRVDVKRSICDTNGSGYQHSIWSKNKIIELDINSKEMFSFSVGDFLALDEDNKIIKVIKNNNRKKTKIKSVKLKKQ